MKSVTIIDVIPSIAGFIIVGDLVLFNGTLLQFCHPLAVVFAVVPVLALISIATKFFSGQKLNVFLVANIAWFVVGVAAIAYLVNFQRTYVF